MSTCDYCSEEFFDAGQNEGFCSDECRDHYRKCHDPEGAEIEDYFDNE